MFQNKLINTSEKLRIKTLQQGWLNVLQMHNDYDCLIYD